MVLAVDTFLAATANRRKVLVYISGIDGSSPKVDFAFSVSPFDKVLPSGSTYANTGHSVGLYNNVMFYVAWPDGWLAAGSYQ